MGGLLDGRGKAGTGGEILGFDSVHDEFGWELAQRTGQFDRFVEAQGVCGAPEKVRWQR